MGGLREVVACDEAAEFQQLGVKRFRRMSGGDLSPGCSSVAVGAIVREVCSGPHELEAAKAVLSVRPSIQRPLGLTGQN